jgi:F-box/leucine-rich repeat protein 2/20
MADSQIGSIPEGELVSSVQVIEPDRPDIPKLKGPKRLLQSLKRLSSSPSRASLRPSSSSSYRGTSRGSVSCVSLNTASLASYGLGLNSAHASRDYLAGFATAPTSTACTPGIDSPFYDPGTGRWKPSVLEGRLGSRSPLATATLDEPTGTLSAFPTIAEDYFSLPVRTKPRQRRANFNFWNDLPVELRMHILSLLTSKEIVRCSAVSKAWQKMCFDGQLWFDVDTADFYQNISAKELTKIVKQAGPFVRDLNLRNCVQLREKWHESGIVEVCQNLENLSLQDCKIDQTSMHRFLTFNAGLKHINLSKLDDVTNKTMAIIGKNCPRLEILNIEWCRNVDTRGMMHVFKGCGELKELRAGETRGWDDVDFLDMVFTKNTLERLLIPGCDSLQDTSLKALFEGTTTDMDYITGRRIAPPRNLKHIDFARCRNIGDTGMLSLAGNVPLLEGLQLSKCKELTDYSLRALLSTVPLLTHLDIDEIDKLTNATLQELAQSPCRDTLQHLCISSCDLLGDAGLLPVVKNCQSLRSMDLDNTRVSDLTLAEAAAQVRARPATVRPPTIRSVTWDGSSALRTERRASTNPAKPKIGLKMTVFDCQNVTWQGVREVLSRNTEIRRPQRPAPISTLSLDTSQASESFPARAISPQPDSALADMTPFPAFPQAPAISEYPTQIVALKVFYGYQQTVQEHTRRVLRADFAAAARLERKWAEYMIASEEAAATTGVGTGNGTGHVNAQLGALGLAGNRRRRRRVREAEMMHADEARRASGEAGALGAEIGVVGRRRRARTAGACAMM